MNKGKFLLYRSALHSVGAVAVGLVAGLFHEWFLLVGWLFIIAVKEIAFDPHPTRFYKWKSVLDMAVWTCISVGVYCIYVAIAG